MANSLEDLPENVKGELALLARDLSENPATRDAFLRLTKQVRPNVPTPEIDITDAANKALTEARETVHKLEAKLGERDAREELDKRRLKLIKDGLATEAEIPEIEKIMLEKGIHQHGPAAEYFRWMQQAAQPTPSLYSPNVLDEGTRANLQKYWKNPAMAAREEGMKALADIRKGHVKLQ